MTVSIPKQLEQALRSRARQCHKKLDDVVQEAIALYLSFDAETLDELTAWQEVRDEALRSVCNPL